MVNQFIINIISFFVAFYSTGFQNNPDTSTLATKSENKLLIEVSPNGRYLQWGDGTPIYIHADTGWSLTRDYSREEVVEYLDQTLAQKFNTVQMSAVFHAVRPDQDIIGPAFHEEDLTRPKSEYWEQVEWVVKEATRRGLIVTLNPIWKKQHVNTIAANGVEKCREYGRWFGNKFKDNPYVIYFVGGDSYPKPVENELAAMAEGIQEIYDGRAIIAMHSRQTTSSLEVYPEGPEWLTLNWTYAYSPLRADWNLYPYEHNLRNYQNFPNVPIQFCEGYYDPGPLKEIEEMGVTDRFGSRYAIRRQAWYASFITGSTGHAYGAEAIWHHNREDETWQSAMEYDSRKDMIHKKSLIDLIPWWTFNPDLNNKLLIGGHGTWQKGDYAVAAITEDRKMGIIYTPVAHRLKLDLDVLAEGSKNAVWYDPTSGQQTELEDFPSRESGVHFVNTPRKNYSGTSDFILLITVN